MFRDFFRGRYGLDTLGFFILLLGLIFTKLSFLWPLSVILLAYETFRMFSKNVTKRTLEQQKFNFILQRILSPIGRDGMFFQRLYKTIQSKIAYNNMVYQQRKQFVFLKCPQCKKNLRLPKNKGKLQVNCPLCGHGFYKKT